MFQSLWQTVKAQISGEAAAGVVADVTRFRRIQASPGYRQAAEMVCEMLQRAGLSAWRRPARPRHAGWRRR